MKTIQLTSVNTILQDTITPTFDGYIVIFDDTTIINQTLEIDISSNSLIDTFLVVVNKLDGTEVFRKTIRMNFKGDFLLKLVIDKTLTGIRYLTYINKSSTSTGNTTTIISTIPQYPPMDKNITQYNYTIPLFQKGTSTYISNTIVFDGTQFMNDLSQKQINLRVSGSSLNLVQPSSDATLNTDLQNYTAPFDFRMAGGRVMGHTNAFPNQSTTAPYNTAPFNFGNAPTGANISVACGEYQAPSAYDQNSIFYFIKRAVRSSINEMTSSIIINVFFTFPIDTTVTTAYPNLQDMIYNCFFNVINNYAPLVKLRIFFVIGFPNVGFVNGCEVPPYKNVLFFYKVKCNTSSTGSTNIAQLSSSEATVLNTFAKKLNKGLFICHSYHAMLNYIFAATSKVRRMIYTVPAPLLTELCSNTMQYYNSSVCDTVKSNQFDHWSLEQIDESNILSKSTEALGYPAYYTIGGKKYNFISELGASFQRANGTLPATDIFGASTTLKPFTCHPVGAIYGGSYTPAKYQLFYDNNTKSAQDQYAHFLNKGLVAGTSISTLNLNSLTEINTGVGIPDPQNFAHFQFINPDLIADEFYIVIHGSNSNMPLYSYYIDDKTPMIKTNYYTEICYFFYMLFEGVKQYKFLINPNSDNFCSNLPNLTYEQKVRMFRLRFQPFDELMGTKANNDAVWNQWFTSNKSLAIFYTPDAKIIINENTDLSYFL